MPLQVEQKIGKLPEEKKAEIQADIDSSAKDCAYMYGFVLGWYAQKLFCVVGTKNVFRVGATRT